MNIWVAVSASPAKVWRAVTDPELIPLWTATGQGGRPVGFSPQVGTRFQFVARPRLGWRGIVDCEVLGVQEPSLLRYSWVGDENGKTSHVSYRIEPHNGGTRFTYDHTGSPALAGSSWPSCWARSAGRCSRSASPRSWMTSTVTPPRRRNPRRPRSNSRHSTDFGYAGERFVPVCLAQIRAMSGH